MPTMIGPQPVLHFLNRDRGVAKKLVALLALGCGTGHVRTAEPMAPMEQGLAFVDVSIVPMDADHVLEHKTVLIRGDRIAAFGPAASTPIPDGATRIDGHGKWLMPGLVDMHVHLDDADDGTLYVANGVTTIRNMWGTPQTLATRADYAAGRALGPTVYTTGPILDGKPVVWPGSIAIENAEEAEKEVADEKAAGYDFVKVYSRLGKDGEHKANKPPFLHAPLTLEACPIRRITLASQKQPPRETCDA
jgi:imidazolonepropionase-like amidohydrolase